MKTLIVFSRNAHYFAFCGRPSNHENRAGENTHTVKDIYSL